MAKIILSGFEVDFDACVNLMDDDVREELHMEMGGECTEQEFLDAYCERHLEKYGTEFEV